MLPSGHGIERSRPCWIGLMAEGTQGVLNIVLVLVIYSFYIYHAEIAVRHVIFSNLPDQRNGKWYTLPFTIPPVSQVLYAFLS